MCKELLRTYLLVWEGCRSVWIWEGYVYTPTQIKMHKIFTFQLWCSWYTWGQWHSPATQRVVPSCELRCSHTFLCMMIINSELVAIPSLHFRSLELKGQSWWMHCCSSRCGLQRQLGRQRHTGPLWPLEWWLKETGGFFPRRTPG